MREADVMWSTVACQNPKENLKWPRHVNDTIAFEGCSLPVFYSGW